MKNCFLICTFIFVSLIFQISNAQDSIWLWKKIWIPVKIISLNRTTVQYIPWNDTTGEIIRRPINELRKIKYTNGETVNLNTWQKQAGLGLTYFIYPATMRTLDNGKYDDTEFQFKSSGMLLSYFYRGHVAALVISAGYAHTSFSYTSHEFSTITGVGYGGTSSYESQNFILQFTPRIHTNIRNVSPFFDLMIGLEFYSSDDAAAVAGDVPFLIEPALGLQVRFFKQWMGEIKAGLCRRSEFTDVDLPYVPDLRIGIYWILFSHISRI